MRIVGMLVFLLFCSLPFLICAFLIYRWRGGWRIAAAIPLVVVVPVLVTEINSGLHGGNLTGVLTILTVGPVLLYLLVLASINALTQRSQSSQSPVTTYVMAILSLLFVLGGILFVW